MSNITDDEFLASVEATVNGLVAAAHEAEPAPAPPPPPYVEPGRGPADAIHLRAQIAGAQRTVCGCYAPLETGRILLHDDESTCPTCVAHRHDDGVRGPLVPVRNMETSGAVLVRVDAAATAVFA